jgi:type I restriction enzyme M protein
VRCGSPASSGPAGPYRPSGCPAGHHLDDFVACYKPGEPRSKRVPTERFRPFSYEELAARDKANLDITLIEEASLRDTDSLLSPEVILREVAEDLEAALSEIAAILEDFLMRGSRQRGSRAS